MNRLILDASVAVTWCFRDQQTTYSTSVLQELAEATAIVPALWFLEVANVTALAEQRGVLRAEDRKRFLRLLTGLRKQVDHEAPERAWTDVHDLAVRHKLTSYDALYLELARRMRLPLASEDRRLRAAAKTAGIAVFATNAPSS